MSSFFQGVDPIDEVGSRTVRKVSRRLIPFIAVLFFINYIDRTNIGFAKLEMNAEIGLTETAYGLASALFFLGYFFFEIPSNLILHKVGARRWIARIMVTWGLVAAATGFVTNEITLHVLRTLLGIAEAGFYPGVILYLTYWFPKSVRAKAIALFAVAVPVSVVIGGPISTALMQFGDGFLGLSGWRFMFIIEGLPAVVLGIVCWFYLTDRPSEARWLAPDEREWLSRTLEAEVEASERRAHWPLRRALTDPKIFALSFVEFGVGYGIYALSFFLPTIVAGFKTMFGTELSLVETGLITAIPFAFASVAMVLWGRHSDRTGERVWHVAAPTLLAAVTVPIALYLNSPFAVMVAITLTAIGVFSAYPIFWSIPGQFLTGVGAAGGIALINSLANLSGFGAPFVTGALADLTGSNRAGLWVAGVILLLAAITMVALRGLVGPSSARVVSEPRTGEARPSPSEA